MLSSDAASAVMKEVCDPESSKAQNINVFPAVSFMQTIAVDRSTVRQLNVAPLVTPPCCSTGQSKCSDV